MTSAFAWKENTVGVTSIEFESINNALIEISPGEANSKEERSFVDRYTQATEYFFPGIVFRLDEFTSNESELLFWRRCLITLAQAVNQIAPPAPAERGVRLLSPHSTGK